MQAVPFDPRATSPQLLRYCVAVADHGSFRRAAAYGDLATAIRAAVPRAALTGRS